MTGGGRLGAADHTGVEWLVEASGCARARLHDRAALEPLVDAIVRGMDLHPVAPAVWHAFPPPPGHPHGGITAFCVLAESHLSLHTFPEHGALCLNVFCCRPRDGWDFAGELRDRLGATDVRVTRVERRYGPAR